MLRPRVGGDEVAHATKIAMGTLGRRVLALDADNDELDARLAGLVPTTAPDLLGVHGVAVDHGRPLAVITGVAHSTHARLPADG